MAFVVSQFQWHVERAQVLAVDRDCAMTPTLYAAKKGYADVLEARLILGADPNQDDGFGGTALMAAACYAKLECARLLLSHGADVSCAYPGDNAGILYMMAVCFSRAQEVSYQEGDYVATADLLIAAGAPIDTINSETDHTALDLLQAMVEVDEATKKGRERRGLIHLLEQRYWREHHGHNPFFRRDQSPSPEHGAQLIIEGAANGDRGHVERTRLRSCIEPRMRKSVVDILILYENNYSESLSLMFSAAGKPNGVSPLCILCGHEQSILSLVGDFARPPSTIREAIHLLTNVLGIPEDESARNFPMTVQEQLERIDAYEGYEV